MSEPTSRVRVTVEGEYRTDEYGYLVVNVGPEPITGLTREPLGTSSPPWPMSYWEVAMLSDETP